MNQGDYSGVHEPVNNLAYTTVTDPEELVKWTGSRFTQSAMRGMDIYYFQVPDTGYRPGSVFHDVSPGDDVRMRAGTDDYRANAGAGPGPYESGSGSYKIIRHQPGNAR